MVQEVTERAKTLRDQEFKLPYQKPLPCLAEKEASEVCYKESIVDPLKCHHLLKNYADCSRKARQLLVPLEDFSLLDGEVILENEDVLLGSELISEKKVVLGTNSNDEVVLANEDVLLEPTLEKEVILGTNLNDEIVMENEDVLLELILEKEIMMKTYKITGYLPNGE
ncbi:hypothetical protein Dsin_021845 [Dipteronia sinensis]|uniref:Uncharacterized protein n=1 Tax=Dipteronia sinensis TaxID=43782 RepID=A0AAE0DZ66_9ROSI|nr:hypothetical protein Dsin_021845 [Dipteronia sinensis]